MINNVLCSLVMFRGHCSSALSLLPTPSSIPRNLLSPIIPALTVHSPASPIIPALTQKQGVGGPHPCPSFQVILYIYLPTQLMSARRHFWSAAASRRSYSRSSTAHNRSLGSNGLHRRNASKTPNRSCSYNVDLCTRACYCWIGGPSKCLPAGHDRISTFVWTP